MKYMGSKNRHAKELLPLILEGRSSGQWYVEPFAGGFNMIDKVTGPRIANDIHPYVTQLFSAALNGWIPPEFVSEHQYQMVRTRRYDFPGYLVGFVGFGCSYSGKWFGGYARGEGRNYARESRDNLLKQLPGLAGVLIYNEDYRNVPIPPHSIIYCDPPYRGTTGYANKFDHDQFWAWVRGKKAEGHTVYVSEYSAPDDFKCLWEKRVNNTLEKNTGSKQGMERLYTL